MFLVRRLVWFVTGATAGFGGAMWIRRQVLKQVERFVPQRVAADAGESARRAGRGVRAAVAEGRAQARGREAELRAELRPGATTPVAPPAEAVAAVPTAIDVASAEVLPAGGRASRGARRARRRASPVQALPPAATQVSHQGRRTPYG
jgi:hypothetical protein